ncbi:MAG: hypothetical protein WCO06_03425 [Candidatus Roizmanbacteria bacterium]
MSQIPFYDPLKTYEANYSEGPFGEFSNSNRYVQKGTPSINYHGQNVFLPFGIPAGPILNSSFVQSAFQKGYDLVVYKTVRSNSFPCHAYPNIIPVDINGDLTLQRSQTPVHAKTTFTQPLTITNSFGVPSKKAEIWQEDVKIAISYEGIGQVLILSFMGTVKPNQTRDELINDFVLSAQLAFETTAKILEVNLSCPNIGNEGLVCYDLSITEEILFSIKNAIGNKPLIVKTGYFENETDLLKFAQICNKYAQGISAINTIPAPIVNDEGIQALPGKNRLKSGICGNAIRWAGLDMIRRLSQMRNKYGFTYTLDGVGGVQSVNDYNEYIKNGADAVFSATGSMWNPFLAQEIKSEVTNLF